jgi:hypothetical protein
MVHFVLNENTKDIKPMMKKAPNKTSQINDDDELNIYPA